MNQMVLRNTTVTDQDETQASPLQKQHLIIIITAIVV